MKNIICISLTFILLGATLSCKTNKSNKTTDDKLDINKIDVKSKHLLIYLKRGACFGKCPEDEVAIYNDGTIIYNGKRNTDFIGSHKGQLDQSVIKDIETRMKSVNFEEIPSEFGMHVRDLPQKNVVVRIDGKKKEFQYIQSKYDDLNSLIRMVGDLYKDSKLESIEK